MLAWVMNLGFAASATTAVAAIASAENTVKGILEDRNVSGLEEIRVTSGVVEFREVFLKQ